MDYAPIDTAYIYDYIQMVELIISHLLTFTLVTLGCLAASSSQPGHHGVSAISNNLHDPGCYRILADTENQAL